MMAKTKYNAISLALASILILILGSMLPAMAPVQAQKSTPMIQTGNKAIFDQFQKVQPTPLSKADLVKAENIALSNTEVKQDINGMLYSLMSQGFVGNMKTNPGIWYPQLNFNVDNKTQLVVVVDPSSNKVIRVDTGTIGDKLSAAPGVRSYAIDGYDGQYTVQGLEMDPTAPSYTPNSIYNFTAFTVNGEETGATLSYLCDPTHVADSYWMQAGFDFDTTGPYYAHLVWADTGTSCNPQDISSYVPYVANANYYVYIFAQPSSSVWTVYVQKDTGESYTMSRSGMNYYTMQTSDDQTSVWFENSNTISGSSTWNTQFSTSPTTTAWLQTPGSSSWYGWDVDYQVEHQNCSSGDWVNHVISGNLEYGSSAQWNLSNMAEYYPAC
jgi:hypothetical protein